MFHVSVHFAQLLFFFLNMELTIHNNCLILKNAQGRPLVWLSVTLPVPLCPPPDHSKVSGHAALKTSF